VSSDELLHEPNVLLPGAPRLLPEEEIALVGWYEGVRTSRRCADAGANLPSPYEIDDPF
jgi:hypothetical protein